MKKLGILCVSIIFVVALYAQTGINVLSFGQAPSGGIATDINQCPLVTVGYSVCPVAPINELPFLAFSIAGYNAGAPFPIEAQGPAGVAGPVGPSGVAGLQGPVGPEGPIGQTGMPGTQGPVGPVGATGLAGPQGPVGAQGLQGVVGPTGPAGPRGIANGSTFTLTCKPEANHSIPSGFSTTCTISSLQP